MIDAAGGVVWRWAASPHDRVEVLILTQPGRPGWSLPKGKLRFGEDALDAALREVREETGLRCEAGAELGQTWTRSRRGRAKRVRYWEMRPVAGRLRPNEEIEQICWVPIEQAAARLAGHDIEVLEALWSYLVSIS